MTPYTPTFDLYTILLLTGVIQGALLSILLLKKKSDNPANIFLGFLALAFTLSLTEIFLNHSGLMMKVLFLYNFSEPVQFLIGPFIFLYFGYLAGRSFSKFQLLHFLPFFLFALYLLFEFTAPVQQKYNNYIVNYLPQARFIYVESPADLDPLKIRKYLTGVVIYVHILIYVSSAVPAIGRTLFSQKADARKSWINHFIIISIIGLILFPISKIVLPVSEGENIVGIYITFFIYMIGYFVIKDSPFFKAEKKKYGTSGLSDELVESKIRKLNRLMDDEKPYLTNDLSLGELSKKLGLSEHHMSQIINEHLKTNFFGLINQYRVIEASHQLKDPKYAHLKIEEIGYQVGYNSKSAFFAAFKKEFESTPQAFRKNAE